MSTPIRATNNDDIIFSPEGKYLNADVIGFGKCVQALINIGGDKERISLQNYKFESQLPFIFEDVKTTSDLADKGIPILDYYIYRSLKTEEKMTVEWKVNELRPSITEGDIANGLFALYFNLMTRGKALADQDGEDVPAFVRKNLGHNTEGIEKLVKALSANNLEKLRHLWINEVSLKNLPNIVRSRLAKGISGSRLFTIFRDYKPNNLNPTTEALYNKLRQLALDGPFWEFHHFYQPKELELLSVGKNLLSFIFEIYNEESIRLMKKNKSLFRSVKVTENLRGYETWTDDNFFKYYKNKLKFD